MYRDQTRPSVGVLDPHSGTYFFSRLCLSFQSQAVQADLVLVSLSLFRTAVGQSRVLGEAMAIFVDSVDQEGILDREGKPSRL